MTVVLLLTDDEFNCIIVILMSIVKFAFVLLFPASKSGILCFGKKISSQFWGKYSLNLSFLVRRAIEALWHDWLKMK